MADNTNPDLVDTADQAFGLGLPSQSPDFKSIPATTSTVNVAGDPSGNTKPVTVDQEILVGPSQVHRLNVDGGTFNPQSANVVNTTQNNVAGQTYGTGTPANVNV